MNDPGFEPGVGPNASINRPPMTWSDLRPGDKIVWGGAVGDAATVLSRDHHFIRIAWTNDPKWDLVPGYHEADIQPDMQAPVNLA